MVDFQPYSLNPVFTGTGKATWDLKIRERGFILKEDDGYHMWYTGVSDTTSNVSRLKLGYAKSSDGLDWVRYDGNPIYQDLWVEDMMVWKLGDTYYMFAEGLNDVAHLLTSTDKINWESHGSLIITTLSGDTISGPYGTPTVWYENDLWYLFYEKADLGIWLATSTSDDLINWTNLTNDPVIEMGPEPYDRFGLALNQIVKHKGFYYAYYHGTAFEDWREWSTSVAVSDDLIHWKKYQANPILGDNKSSAILVHDGEQYRLYTMHDEVVVHFNTLK